ncbi:MAG: hypothetical protein ACRDTJ_24365, partial [Pseudonocardiaceae bacterium]
MGTAHRDARWCAWWRLRQVAQCAPTLRNPTHRSYRRDVDYRYGKLSGTVPKDRNTRLASLIAETGFTYAGLA